MSHTQEGDMVRDREGKRPKRDGDNRAAAEGRSETLRRLRHMRDEVSRGKQTRDLRDQCRGIKVKDKSTSHAVLTVYFQGIGGILRRATI